MNDDVWQCDQTFVAVENRWTTACGYREIAGPDQGWVVDLLTNGWVVGAVYLAVALILGRIAVTLTHRNTGNAEDDDGMIIALGAVCWPLTLVGAAGWWFMTGGSRKLKRRSEQRRERADQLRADARSWDEKRRTGTPAEREMAAQLAQMCRDQIAELMRR